MAITTIPGANGGDTSIIGTAAADTIKPTDFVKLYVDGKEANDTITFSDATTGITTLGNDGDDVITYAAITGGQVNGNKGTDQIIVNGDVDGNAAIYGGQGNDTMTFKGLVENVTEVGGSIGTDGIEFQKNVSKTKVLGNQDVDTITLKDLGTAVSIYGGKGADIITVEETSGSIVSGDKGADQITTSSHSNNTDILGGADDDIITIGTNDDTGKGSTIEGGVGRDTITVNGDSKFKILGGTDNDTIISTASGSAQTVYGGQGDDTITAANAGVALDNVLFGDIGADTITATAGKDTIEGGDGDDEIDAGDGANSVNGGTGKDTITDGSGASTIYGGKGADTITSGGGNDFISGDTDDDVIKMTAAGLTADDTITGGTGTNTISFTTDGDLLDVDFTGVTDVQNLIFTGAVNGDKATLGAKADTAGVVSVTAKDGTGTGIFTVDGSANANDVSFVGSNTVTVDVDYTGGAGADTFTTGILKSNSKFTGGAGTNTFNVINEKDGTDNTEIEDLKGSDVLKVGAGDVGVAVKVTADYIATTASTNASDGIDDVQLVSSAAGVDINMSAATATTGYGLTGNTGAEVIVGSKASDNITGLGGIDTMTGGAGVDTFEYTAQDETLKTADTTAVDLTKIDVITDFTEATDKIGFAKKFGAANNASLAYKATNATLVGKYGAKEITIVTLDATTLGASTKGAVAAAGNAALIIFNGTDAEIDDSGIGNDLTKTGLGTKKDLQIIGLEGQAGVNYGTLDAGDFTLA